ncbi:MAG TPA: glycoside hydrolase family 38 C-terminal domain-containing protein [Flexivirga sp.]|uniref:alpha-mannosidase n=1 Tax=Flexivirga sp. TaxID=1962927 RepID=UPI002BA9DECF|nr:glycoside hydrolase family 38 C-terminal domain-containing protein [Flexivirga sp.]HWC21143.1 glycoside hydrolase family 38 C-terminal domain-containing protein [Flexivirga sp.]
MHDRRRLIEDRITRVLTERIRPAVHRPVAPLQVEVRHVGGGQGEPVPPVEAIGASYEPGAVGQPWGPAWGTTWFHLTGAVPPAADDGPHEVVIDLGWSPHSPGFQAEGLAYRPDGSVVKGLNPMNGWIPVEPGTEVDLYVEAAANPLVLQPHPFLPTGLGEKATAGDRPLYRLARAEICVRDTQVWELAADLDVLDGLMRELPADDGWRAELLLGIERALDRLDLGDVSATASDARAELAALLARRGADTAHRVSAVGHAHIDSAWLWPVRETVRKVARTVANVTQLLDDHPGLIYAMSSAQQYEWLEKHRPEVFERLKQHVATGRFVPTGGMWVESDTNMVGGEAMARQFLLGQRYFREKFGVTCREVWLPDSFGYSAALPQIVRQAGCTHFLTQKISWNQQNVFPHHTFRWEGIDGTRVFTHFPPVDTYTAELTGRELAHAASNFRDKGATNRSLVPFGYGDGGGGPTREMLQRAARTADLAGSPRVTIESPAQFFAAAEADYPDAPVWVGELYLELHRGTYTSQARTKEGNRRCEHLLREAELWATTAAVRGLADYPADQLTRLWKVVLLQQFHDILPGSSIAWVHREAAENYAAVEAELEELITARLRLLAGSGDAEIAVNATPFDDDSLPSLGAGPVAPAGPAVVVERRNGGVLLTSEVLQVTLDGHGLVVSMVDLSSGRDVIPTGERANLLQLHQDFPNKWDAWDLDEFYRNTVRDLDDVADLQVDVRDDGAAVVTVTRGFGGSSAIQTMTLRPGARQLDCAVDVDWHERETVLKVALPIDVHATDAAYETQFGHLRRPTHTNTSWDAARFEVCAHRFVHVAEPGFGVAVANSATYGHEVTRHEASRGGTFSTVRLSLLRAPRFPDPETDQGRHHRRYALVVAPEVTDAVRAGYRINLPHRRLTGAPIEPLLQVSGGGAVIEAVKLAEDGSGDVIVRLYEPAGARTRVTLEPTFPVREVTQVDLLEDPMEPDGLEAADGSITLRLRPFQLATLRLRR